MEKYDSVEEYFAALPDGHRAALEDLRRTIAEAAPHATEAISYGMPAFRDRDRVLVYYSAFANHFSLFPGSKSSMASLGEDLAPYVAGKGTIRFRYDEPLPRTLIMRIVAARLAENAARTGR